MSLLSPCATRHSPGCFPYFFHHCHNLANVTAVDQVLILAWIRKNAFWYGTWRYQSLRRMDLIASPSNTGLGSLTSFWTNEDRHKEEVPILGPKRHCLFSLFFLLACPRQENRFPSHPPVLSCSLRPMTNVIGENTKRLPCTPVAWSTWTQPIYRCMTGKGYYCCKMSLGVIFMSIIMATVNWYTQVQSYFIVELAEAQISILVKVTELTKTEDSLWSFIYIWNIFPLLTHLNTAFLLF